MSLANPPGKITTDQWANYTPEEQAKEVRKQAAQLPDPSIELLGDPPLFVQQPSLLQAHRRLVRRYSQDKPLGLRREVGSPSPCYEHADFIMKPQSHGRNRDVSVSGRISHHQRRRVRIISQPGVERLTNVLRLGHQISGLSDLDHIDGYPANRISQPRIDEI